MIRRAARDDAPSVRDVVERAIRHSAAEYYSPAQIDAWATGIGAGGRSVSGVATMIDDTVAFVAVVDGRGVGFANLDRDDVDQLYVDPDFGGRGIARGLYAAVEAEARARGVSALTATASLRAVGVFTRFGFSETERAQRDFNGESFAVVHMRKELSAEA